MAIGAGEAIKVPGLIASEDLSSAQYTCVKMATSTANGVLGVDAVTDTAIGVLQNEPASGYAADVVVCGISKVIAGTSVGWRPGVPVRANLTGVAPNYTTTGTYVTDKPSVGFYILRETSVAKSDIITIMVLPGIFPAVN